MANKTTTIATAVTSGNTPWVQLIGDGNVIVTTGGAYDGATVAIQSRLTRDPVATETTYDDNGNGYTTAPSTVIVNLSPQHEIRCTTTGGGGSQSINFYQSQYRN